MEELQGPCRVHTTSLELLTCAPAWRRRDTIAGAPDSAAASKLDCDPTWWDAVHAAKAHAGRQSTQIKGVHIASTRAHGRWRRVWARPAAPTEHAYTRSCSGPWCDGTQSYNGKLRRNHTECSRGSYRFTAGKTTVHKGRHSTFVPRLLRLPPSQRKQLSDKVGGVRWFIVDNSGGGGWWVVLQRHEKIHHSCVSSDTSSVHRGHIMLPALATYQLHSVL